MFSRDGSCPVPPRPVDARVSVPPARGAIPSLAIIFLRFMDSQLLAFKRSALAHGSVRTRVELWVLLRVSIRIDVEPQHHRVIFVDRVVTMHRVSSEEVAEAEEELGFGVVLQPE